MNRTVTALVLGVLLPFAVCAALYPARNSVPNTDAALVCVAVVVAVATLGIRLAGLVAALSAGLSFDLFLTSPYGSFSIHSKQDVETVLLLLVVGVAVTEIAAQGWRQHRRVGDQAAYLDGLHQAIAAVSTGLPSPELITRTVKTLTAVLDLQNCRFVPGTAVSQPELIADGTVRWGDASWDVEHEGLPLQAETALVVRSGSTVHGQFLLSPKLDSRPGLTQRLVAASLASQVGAALATVAPSR